MHSTCECIETAAYVHSSRGLHSGCCHHTSMDVRREHDSTFVSTLYVLQVKKSPHETYRCEFVVTKVRAKKDIDIGTKDMQRILGGLVSDCARGERGC